MAFLLLRALPGRPDLVDEVTSSQIQSQWRNIWGLEKPLIEQYASYWYQITQGSLGWSYQDQSVSVIDRLARALPNTLNLSILALITSVLASLTLAAFTLKKTWLRGIISLGVAIPTAVVAIGLVIVFAQKLAWFPVARLESWTGWVLPVIAIAFRPTFKLSQVMIDEFDRLRASDENRFLISLGFSVDQISRRWFLKQSLVSYSTYLATLFNQLIGGSVLIEILFSFSGVGSLFLEGLNARDYPLVVGITLVIGTVIFFGQLLLDLMLAIIDPRIRASL